MGHYVSGSKFFTPLKKDVRGTQFFEHAIDNVVTQLPVVSAFRAQAFNEEAFSRIESYWGVIDHQTVLPQLQDAIETEKGDIQIHQLEKGVTA